MKILVLGSNGFIGKSLVKHLSPRYQIVSANRENINLLNHEDVSEFLEKEQFDIIIGAAVSHTDPNTLIDTRNNLGLFMPFFENSHRFGKFLNFGSGAEFDTATNIDNFRETSLFQNLPNDSYAFASNIKSRLCYLKSNFYTFRIFNCFGGGEKPTRIFPRFIQSKSIFRITNDRYFDYFSIQDLCYVVDHFISNNINYKDINLTYREKYKISEVLKMFKNYHNIKTAIEIESTSQNNYTGDCSKLYSMGLSLGGLTQGLKNYDLSSTLLIGK